MYNTVVMTCGISLLMGNHNYFSIKKGSRMDGIISASLQSREITSDIKKKIDQFLDKGRKEIEEALKNPHAISAEYSMIHTLMKNNKLSEKMKIILIATNTVGSNICVPLLKDIFEKQLDADVKVLFTDINVSSSKLIREQLGNYLHILGQALSEGDPSSTCFAPIGGYKVMTSLGYIVGSFLHYPTSYLHEEQQILIEIPPMPLDIDDDFVQKNSDLLRKCKQDYIDLDELNYNEKDIVRKYNAIFSIEDGLVALNPFGLFLFERSKYNHLINTNYIYSEQVERIMKQNNHQSIFIKQQMRELVKKLKEGVENDEVKHEKNFKILDRSKVLFNLYKGASNGQTAFRLAYKYDWAKDELIANYLWLNHDKYEREVSNGVGIYKEESISAVHSL
ncbi:CRISPR-associated protein [Ureibacillus thermosphaericus]|uniref:Putative CRISPR-associated protein (TIGR02619 family) n=1 Tax=Ureibacillus thermosphaericus TaxID=51173 RepID=A0A840PWI1_URETH|nr:CRISPR-associated protein [Ureibacillus thermosphaericus]MBB5149081.1 putative CRISPR-associated protein (TIGR02619 family) [Ureibacillus thermosphaericus]NKZ31845.1 CRISPR-associated protein [Ureibacillus thermosphaericus]